MAGVGGGILSALLEIGEDRDTDALVWELVAAAFRFKALPRLLRNWKWFQQSENCGYMALPWKQRLLYEIGQATMSSKRYTRFVHIADPVARGRAIVDSYSGPKAWRWFRALVGDGRGLGLGIIGPRTVGTGPTPGAARVIELGSGLPWSVTRIVPHSLEQDDNGDAADDASQMTDEEWERFMYRVRREGEETDRLLEECQPRDHRGAFGPGR